MNIHLEINATIIKRMNKYNITNDILGSVLFILIGLYEGKIELLDELDDFNRKRRMILIYRLLERINLIELSDDDEVSLYCLTTEGVELVEFIKKEFIHVNNTSLTSEVIVKEELVLTEESPENWIEDWINLFPTRKYGRTYRSNPKDVLPRMKDFIKNHGYSKEVIFDATRRYLKEQEEETDHRYAMESHYFIKKGKGDDANSKLSAVCYEWVNKDHSQELDNSFRDLV